VSSEYEYYSSKSSGPLGMFQEQSGYFLENGSDDFDNISIMYGEHLRV
jgi:hypothetical protein